MPRSLIVSDRPHLAYAVESAFSMSGWSSISIGVNSMLGKASDSASKYQCLVFVLDAEFKCRFSSVLCEIGAFVKNCSRHTSFYFLVGEGYDTSFIPWFINGKAIFQNALNPNGINQAIGKIIRLESMFTTNPTFVSPMDSI
jgi:hypothetical protein